MQREHLPEGTDTIIAGAGFTGDIDDPNEMVDAATPQAAARDGDDVAPQEPLSFSGRIDAMRGQASDKARDFVTTAKDRATAGIDDLVQMIEEAASEIDDKVGTQYGDYLRRAADSVSGVSDTVKNKDVDVLFTDARALIRKSPGIAIGVTATVGFIVARLARAGMPDDTKVA